MEEKRLRPSSTIDKVRPRPSPSLFASARDTARKSKPLGDICLEIAEFAKDRDYRTLDHLMRMAAAEAYEQTTIPIPDVPLFKNEMIGLWDWDVTNNRNYLDPRSAALFGVDPQKAVHGLPVEDYMKAIHPDDIKGFTETLQAVVKEGGCFKATYRVIHNDRIIWIHASGACFVGPRKTPVRFPGAMFDVTASMQQNNAC